MEQFITIGGVTRMYHNQEAEYLLILTPYGEVRVKAMDFKYDFSSKFDCKIAASTKPHVTLLKFSQHEAKEDRVIRCFRQIAKMQAPIKVELKDFGSFESHTIYINVISKEPLLNLSKNLKVARPLLNSNPAFQPIFVAEPHLTIARSLSLWQFEKASLEYANMSFRGHFIAGKMTLLKKRIGNMSYEHVMDFKFLDTPNRSYMQGILFK